MTQISKMIRLVRATDNISQTDLAEQIGISRPVIRRVEAGKSVDIGDALKIITWLFEAADIVKSDLNKR